MPIPKESLTSLHQILHLTHHRNKNQHRLSKWYKAFSQLRRQVQKLVNELEVLETAEKFSVSGPKGGKKGGGVEGRKEGESKYVKAAREKVEARARFLGRWVVRECYLAFSNLVADNQYSALGLMLLGTLAGVKSVLGMLVEDEDESLEDAVALETAEVVETGALMELDERRADDFGEVVKRDEILGTGEGKRIDVVGEEGEESQDVTDKKQRSKKRLATDKDEAPSNEESTPSKPPKRKRKKGKGDAFDDLFSSLL